MDFTSIQIGQKYGSYLTFGKLDLELVKPVLTGYGDITKI